MSRFTTYLKIVRLPNALMAAAAVLLGFWLTGSGVGFGALLLLVVAAVASTGFGNIVNDLHDIESDRINHPDRPLPRGDMAAPQAFLFAAILAAAALVSAFLASPVHGAATLLPLALLVAYAVWLKGTPLAGNVLVALLVAYPVVFGGLGSPRVGRILVPAALAFLLNMMREIVKDVQDRPGDQATNCRTTAVLSPGLLRWLLIALSAIYLPLTFVPVILGDFGVPYLVICAATVVPLHAMWFGMFSLSRSVPRLHLVSNLIKFEMLCGLIALAIDHLFG